MKSLSLSVRNRVRHLLVLVSLSMIVLSPTPAMAEVTLDTLNPLANFTQEGGQSFTGSPTVLSLNDGAITDIINFYAPDPDAASSEAVDLFAAFKVVAGSLSNATDLGLHFVINDGTSKAVIGACIVKDGEKGIGLAGGSVFYDPTNYPVFVPVNWSAPTTVRIRRTAEGDGEIVEINGVAPNPRALLIRAMLSPRNRTVATIEFGCTSPEATANVDFTEFFTERPAAGDNTPPVLDPIDDVFVTLPLNSTETSMAVTFPTPTATDDSGTVTVTTSPASGAVFLLGTTTVEVTATDDAGNSATGSFTVTVLHNFSGFLQPVDELPVVNMVNAGQGVPVKFSLSGDKGLNIFAAGYPISGPIACDATEPGAVIEETVAAGGSSLSYDAAADRYTYVWKTQKTWKGTCRILALRLSDGSEYFAKFRFR